MRIIFLGTPTLALHALEAIHASRHTLTLVVTQPDRPKGRGLKDAPPPVKEWALMHDVPLLQPDDLKAPVFADVLAAQKADLLVVVAFSLLPPPVLACARLGAVNLHVSLLPRYRGAAPIQHAILNGDTETGATVFRLDEKMDHGLVLAQRPLPIGPDETAGELGPRLMTMGASLLVETLDALEAGTAQGLPQNHQLASRAPKILKEHGLIDWIRTAAQIHNQVRALNPAPLCFSPIPALGKTLRILRTRLSDEPNPGPGRIVFAPGGFPLAGCADRALQLLEVQPEGKPVMDGRSWQNGVRDRSLLYFAMAGTDPAGAVS